jgi:ATP-binding protein involved in chromosome partitioning
MILADIRRKLLFVSSQEGVGKSSVVNHLAHCLRNEGLQVGILDFFSSGTDILSLCTAAPVDGGEVSPPLLCVASESGLKADCIASPAAVERFLAQTHLNELDYLMVDTPPGPDAALVNWIRTIPDSEVILVTAPNRISTVRAREMIRLFRDQRLPIHGWIENMCGYLCQHSLQRTNLFSTGCGSRAVFLMDFPFLGRIPYSPHIPSNDAAGSPAWRIQTDSEIADAFDLVSRNIITSPKRRDPATGKES